MTVREFDGVSDELVTGIGAASGMVYGTVAALIKFSTVSSFRDWTMLHTAGGSFVWTPVGMTNFSTLHMFSNGVSSNSGINPGTTSWKLMVVRKATGTTAPRFSIYDYTSNTWSHAAGANLDDSLSAPGPGGQVRFTYQGSGDFFGGRIAARALWSNALPWSADPAGDAAIEASGLKDSAVNWASASPTAFWLFNQASTATAVDDVSTAGTGGQTSIVGTTVVTGDDPAGFDFSLASVNEGTLAGSFSPPAASIDVTASAEVTVGGTFAAPATAMDATATAEVTLGGTFAVPTLSAAGDSVPADPGTVDGSFSAPSATFSARSGVNVSILGTFSIPAFTGTGGVPIPSRDILVTIGPGDRPATSIAAGPSRVSVAASTIQRTEIGA